MDAPTYTERRAAMADETRTRILDACVTILARGVTELSIPAVAREAGVSIPTVYRNFPDKKTLVGETVLHLRRLRGHEHASGLPSTLEELPAVARTEFEKAATSIETVYAALASEPITELRRDSEERTARVERVTAMLGDALHGLSPRDRQRAVWMTTVLCSSNTARGFRDLLGITPREAADTVSWTVARLVGRDSLDTHGKRRGAKRRTKR